ncbi:hypothetical protein BGZ83_002934 [Gryganskiella cystojenkinii]|nr:hypothetical protein BGZ83_002934 [Gryganskiella cystojenkinii]
MEAIVSIPGAKSVAIAFPKDSHPTVFDLQCRLEDMLHIPLEDQRIQTSGGLPLLSSLEDSQQQESHGDVPLFPSTTSTSSLRYLSLSLRMNGGKGGFGSMLRAAGGRMNASKGPTNTDACRDLSGRRIKTVNDAKKMAEYLQKEPEREKAKRDSLKRKIEEKLEVAERQTTKSRKLLDREFEEQYEQDVLQVKSAVAQAIKESLKPKYMGGGGAAVGASSSAGKRSSSASSGSGSDDEEEEKAAGSSSSSTSVSSSSAKGKSKLIETETKKKVAVKSLSMWDNMSDYESSEEEGDEDEEEEEEEQEEVKEEVEAPKAGSKAKGKGKGKAVEAPVAKKPTKASRSKK